MNKADLVAIVAEKADLTKKEAVAAVDAVMTSIIEDVAAGNKVQLIGFGTFETSTRAEREGRNPQTGETMTIPATIVPKFKAGKAFKDAVNK